MPSLKTCKVCGSDFTPEKRSGPPSVTCSESCREARRLQGVAAAQRRYRGTLDIPERPCAICGTSFRPTAKTGKTCSFDCSIRWRRKLSRDREAAQYQVKPVRPDFECESCKTLTPTPRTGPQPRWCGTCRANHGDRRVRRQVAVRRCWKCEAPVPEAVRKPGRTVCGNCRADDRDPVLAVLKDRRRTLRKYGLTQESFDQLLLEQDGKCRTCGTDDPGGKGWCIDHCHQSGRVRALLCHRCNMALGYGLEDPRILRALADFAEQWQQVLGAAEIKI